MKKNKEPLRPIMKEEMGSGSFFILFLEVLKRIIDIDETFGKPYRPMPVQVEIIAHL